tara:strand:+ start:281 stop:1051 length:771 start_codon:yes stop_codon:yes gene_type:complete
VNENDKKSAQALRILKEYFKSDTELYREFRLFNSLARTKVSSDNVAFAIVSEARTLSRKIDRKQLDREKSLLIKDINYTLDESVYHQKVPEYKVYATIQTLLNNWRSTGDVNLITTAKYEDQLISWLTSPSSPVTEITAGEIDADNLIVQIMTTKLNEKYSKVLSDHQRELIQDYVFSLEDPDSTSLLERLQVLKERATELVDEEMKNLQSESELFIKLKETKEKILKENIEEVSDTTISRYLEVSQLVQELQETE